MLFCNSKFRSYDTSTKHTIFKFCIYTDDRTLEDSS